MTRGAAPGVPFRDWVAVLGAVLGAFMAVLDIQITNASLKDIQGGIAASLDEGGWISTAYLAAEIVAIPLTGWLCEVFSTRLYLLGSCALFLVFSVLCGLSASLAEMILFRAGQGFTCGALIPTAMSVVLGKLPPAKQPMGLALFGLSATFAPAIGPTVGGWLTDTYSWHAIFYVNLLPGGVLLWAVWYGLDPEPPRLERLRHGDWAGILSMAVGLGCLIAVLEEGEREDWFTAGWIRWCTAVAAVEIPAFVLRELTARAPFIDLRLLGRRGLGLSTLSGLAMGVGLYGSTFLLPVYLAQVQGYDALQIGRVVMWAGLPQLFLMPLVPRLMGRVDWRWLVAFGFLLFGLSCVMNGHMSHDTAGPQLRLAQLARALGQPFIIVPLASLATVGVGPAERADASSLFNMARNLGGSLGISLLSTLITVREHYHFAVVAERLTTDSPRTQAWLAGAARALPPGHDTLEALARLQDLVRREAFTMTYSDCFLVMGGVLLASIAVVLLMPKPRAGGGTVAVH
jgi:MFS transporter, DHA2 family, multidrug resistance protein